MKLNVKQVLDAFKLIGYGLLLAVDEAITVLSMFSVGHSIPEKIGLAIFAFIIVLLGAWVFLSGIRAKGAERLIKLGAWVLSVVLIVAINWAFTRTMIQTQSSDTESVQTTTAKQTEVKQKQIDLSLKSIEVLQNRLAELNKWQDKERDSITKAITDENARLDKLMAKEETTTHKIEGVQAMNVFKKMSLGTNSEIVSDLWWLLAFLVAQLFTVLAAPKSDDDVPMRRKRTPRVPKPEDLTESVWWYVWAHWSCIRTGRTPPHKLLPFHEFDVFITPRFRAIPERVCQLIAQAARSAGVIEGDEIRELDEETARKKIMSVIDKH
jgi:hypothetical protein